MTIKKVVYDKVKVAIWWPALNPTTFTWNIFAYIHPEYIGHPRQID